MDQERVFQEPSRDLETEDFSPVEKPPLPEAQAQESLDREEFHTLERSVIRRVRDALTGATAPLRDHPALTTIVEVTTYTEYMDRMTALLGEGRLKSAQLSTLGSSEIYDVLVNYYEKKKTLKQKYEQS